MVTNSLPSPPATVLIYMIVAPLQSKPSLINLFGDIHQNVTCPTTLQKKICVPTHYRSPLYAIFIIFTIGGIFSYLNVKSVHGCGFLCLCAGVVGLDCRVSNFDVGVFIAVEPLTVVYRGNKNYHDSCYHNDDIYIHLMFLIFYFKKKFKKIKFNS